MTINTTINNPILTFSYHSCTYLHLKSMQDSSGNRIATCLIYLNDVDSGGATTFKDLGIQVYMPWSSSGTGTTAATTATRTTTNPLPLTTLSPYTTSYRWICHCIPFLFLFADVVIIKCIPVIFTYNLSLSPITSLTCFLNTYWSTPHTRLPLTHQVKPQKGKGLLFFPSFHDGKPDDRTMHAGQVCMDTKWIAQVIKLIIPRHILL